MNFSENLSTHFSFDLGNTIWKSVADPKADIVVVEVRDKQNKQVSFSALEVSTAQWLWKDIRFDEAWWIGVHAVVNGVVLFVLYNNPDNPESKSVIAYSLKSQSILWWKNNFVVAFVTETSVTGVETKFGSRETVFDLKTGERISHHDMVFDRAQNFSVLRPFQYQEGTEHFQTVSTFLNQKCNFSPVLSVEYCEHGTLIFISAFVREKGLANYLFVFNSNGELLLKETLGEDLSGIASDTFFILTQYLIFVKNKRELVSYMIV